VRRRLSEELGAAFDVTGVAMAAFPLPDALLELTTFEGLNGEKIERLRGVAETALEGRLDPERLRALPPAEAQAELQQIRGIGPFYAGLIHIRSSGVADVATTEPRALASAARVYGLAAPPGAETLAVSVTLGFPVVMSDRPGWVSGRWRADSYARCRPRGLTDIGCVARHRPRITGVT
jgi:DNA-3-methyladenine glycosylase II